MKLLLSRNVLSILVLLALFLSVVALPAAAEPDAPLAAIPLSAPYTQIFDTLAVSGTGNAWTNDSTIAGWYSTRTTYNAGTGSSNAGALYSFGTGTAVERALGSVASGTTTTVRYGARFTNDTSNSVTSITVSYTGEQWRNGGNTTQHKLTMDYQIGATVTDIASGIWTSVTALDFTGPIATGTAAALDGNLAANRVAISHTFNVSIAPGYEIMLRWNDPDDGGADHGLAIDDLAVTVTMSSGDTPPTVASTTPANNAQNVALNTTITVNFSDDGPDGVDVTANAFTVQCPVGSPVTFTSTPTLPADNITSVVLTPVSPLPPDTICTVTVVASQVTDNDGAADPMAANYVFTFRTVNPNACSAAFTPIYSIQGSGLSAAITGAVTTQGVVVGDFEGASPALRGFYLQDLAGDGDLATSDGIFVFNGDNNSVSLGDVVRVTGTAAEFQNQTQISSVSALLPCSSGSVSPLDVTLPFASADYAERFEGMLVRLPQTLYVSEHFQLGRFGQVVLTARSDRLQQPTNVVAPGAPALALQASNDLNRIILDDALNSQNPDPIVFGRGGLPLSASNTLRGGDSAASIVGVLTYTWSGDAASGNAYRVRPIGALNGGVINFLPANTRPVPPSISGRLRVTAANLLNYFNSFSGCTLGVSGGATDCRGADNSTEFDRQWPKTVANLVDGGADVIGVMEIENDGYGPSSAVQDLVNRLNAATAAGTYAFIDADAGTSQTNALGTDAIKVGLIYKPAKVTPVGTTAALNSTAFVNGGDGAARNRPALAQAFQEVSSGHSFIVVVNHLKSKGSACDVADAGDGQGNCNVVRTNAANLLTAWLAGNPTGTGDPDILIMGDLNSYAQEDPITAIKNAGYTNLIQDRLGMDAYSYVFDGQWGYLDHALASAALNAQVTGVLEWHINADEPSALDYNTDFKTAGQIISLYSPDRFRSSDHDPVIIGLTLTNPLAVTLASFSAEPNVDRVTVDWETVSEFDNAGFNLYRSVDAAGPLTLLAYLPSQAPGSMAGAAYSYDDLDVQPGQTYWYTLEDVSLSGATTLHGPVSATVQAPTAVTLGDLQATPAANVAGLPWLWIVAGAGGALGMGRLRRRL